MKININIEKNYKIILLLIIIVGFGLRLININKHLLWCDEAETVINSTQIITDGYPNAYYNNQLIYENADSVKIPVDDPIYKYASVNYLGSKYENNKGWFTYYFLAPWLKIFGFSELSARLPFLLFYILTALLIFIFSQKIWTNKKISLIACLIFSLDFWSIQYGNQARYYSPLIFSSLLTLYYNYLYITDKKNIYLFLTTSSLLLTFHTHIILFLVLALFLFYYNFIKNKYLKINKVFIWNFIYLLIGTIPWLILVKFWTNFYSHVVHDSSGSAHGNMTKILWLFLISIIYFYSKALSKITPKLNLEFKKIKFEYLSSYVIFAIIFIPLLIPSESLESRVFISLLPIILMLIGNFLYNFVINIKKRKYYIFCIFILSILYYILFFSLNGTYDAFKVDWIKKTIQYSNDSGLEKKDIILTNWQNLSFTLYSEQTVYHIAVLREDFINNFPNRILAVFQLNREKDTFFDTITFYKPRNNDQLILRKYLNRFDRLKNCPMSYIQENVVIFDCPALDKID